MTSLRFGSKYLHDGDKLSCVQVNSVHLGDEDGSHGDKERRSIHIDRRSDGNDKLRNSWINMVVFMHAAECDWESSRSAISVSISFVVLAPCAYQVLLIM